MRRIRKILSLLLVLCMLPVITVSATGSDAGLESADEEEFRGMWVATVINLDYPSKTGLTVAEMKSEADEILDSCAAMGFNAVIFQVRPCGDALYKSDIYPWSQYLTGTQGVAPADGFDPLQYWVEGAHARGLELHAWINPYRVARNTTDINSLSADNPARQHPEWVVKHSDGHMYLDPGIPEVRKMVIDGVEEIVSNYAVDGIHFDDYFYPGGSNFADSATYKKYGSGFSNIDDWRRNNTDLLVKETYDAIKAINSEIDFGISPFGIWANKSTSELGSDTTGNQSYTYYYADTRKWVKSGWIDYICPQLYWNIGYSLGGYSVADYKVLLEWWSDVVRDTGVKLYVGHASYRTGNSDSTSPWYGTAELRRQLDLNSVTPEVSGSVHFRYSFFKTYPALGNFITTYYGAWETSDGYPVTPDISNTGLYVGRPSGNITTSYSSMYVIGKCDPSKKLYLNGNEVTEVTSSGYFGVNVSLKSGVNTLTFTQDGSMLVRTITRGSSGSSSASGTKLAAAEIVEGSTYPRVYDVYIKPGEKITFRCTAPIGATVTVTLAGKVYKLYPATTKAPSSDGIYGTQYSYTYTVPNGYQAGKVYTIGTPIYTMSYQGKTSTRAATGDLKVVTDGAPYYATVTADGAFLYASSSTSGGPVSELTKGMTEYITAVTSAGEWVRLANGYWVQRGDVSRAHETYKLTNALSSPVYTTGTEKDTLTFKTTASTAAWVTCDGSTLKLNVTNAASSPLPVLPADSLFKGCSVSMSGTTAIYSFILKDGAKLDGYYIDVESGSMTLNLKRRPVAQAGETPLAGLTIMLDPGHGGSDPGALGPLGAEMSESDIVLYLARKLKFELESMGATVLMTRSADVYVSLQDRLVASRAAKPDLFISLHDNAMAENVDATKIYGLGAWYRESLSEPFATAISKYVTDDLGRYNRSSVHSNLYVCRGTWAPSVLIECGFICCPSEYEWLVSDSGQTELARSIARGVVNYFN